MEIKISEVIRKKRRDADMSQESLAEVLGVSVQAVSKWETSGSYPDITMLPRIAEYFKISMDELFFGAGEKEDSENGEIPVAPSCEISAGPSPELPDDGKLRIVQYIGSRLLTRSDYDPNIRIMLETPKSIIKKFDVEIWGSAHIDGDIHGRATAGGSISCGNVGGSASAGDSINCGNVGGSASAGDSVNCGNMGGSASAGDSINCGNVGGSARAENGSINCGDIGHNAHAEKDIRCHRIKGSATCGGNIIYEK